MKTIYFKAGDAEWKYELEDEQYQDIITSLLEDKIDPQDMLDESLETLRDISFLTDDEITEDDDIDQAIAVAYLWYHFNTIADESEHITGDVAIIEDEDGLGVSVLPAHDAIIQH
jgi:hypothetical protein